MGYSQIFLKNSLDNIFWNHLLGSRFWPGAAVRFSHYKPPDGALFMGGSESHPPGDRLSAVKGGGKSGLSNHRGDTQRESAASHSDSGPGVSFSCVTGW